MYEFEIKFRIENLPQFLENCQKLGIEFGNEKNQIDGVWIAKDADGTNLVSGMPVVRTREEGEKKLVTLKIELKHGTFEEHETTIGSIKEIEDIVGNLGMRKLVEINKTRKNAQYKNYNLCLDNVKNLGDFIEIEVVSKDYDDNAKEKILELSKVFGLTDKDVVVNTYNTLLCRKYNLK